MVAGIGLARLVKGASIDPNRLAKVTRGDVARSVVATGKIQPITKVEVKSKASGIVEKLYVDINNQVKKGQQLAQLDQQEILAQVDAQRAQLASAEANVSTFEANIEQDKVNAAAPDLPMYKATLDRNLEMKKRHRQPAGAGRRQQGLPGRAHPARFRQGADRRGHGQAEAGAGAGAAEPGQPEATGGAARIHHHRGAHGRRDSVARRGDRRRGQLHPGAGLDGHAGDDRGRHHEVYVQGKVDEADIAHVYMGQPARIKVESFRDRMFNGKVTKIAPMGVEKDNVTTFEVRVSINNPGGELKANMTANAEILLDEHKGVLTVPENAVIYDNQKNASVQIPDKQAEGRHAQGSVKVGLSNGSVTEIVSGLKEGDQVVLQQ